MLKILELFGGIGACSKALEKLGIQYEIADYVEIDKYAVKSFNAMHNTNFEPQDICEWNKDIEVDLIMHGSPCQDFSLAGKQAGGDKDSGTRSSLMYETIRIVEKLKPKYVIWENVKNLLSKKHRHNFDAYLETMVNLGYKNFYKVLNAKDYGIPQNRERVFTISIRDDNKHCDDNSLGFKYYREYKTIYYKFPPKQELKLKIKDMLENEVDDYYYNVCPSMIKALQDGKVKDITNLDYCNTLTTKQARWNNAGMVKDKKGLRYITGREAFKLMGFDDSDYDKVSMVCNIHQIWKQAGNSIVVNVLEAILDNLLIKPKIDKEIDKLLAKVN